MPPRARHFGEMTLICKEEVVWATDRAARRREVEMPQDPRRISTRKWVAPLTLRPGDPHSSPGRFRRDLSGGLLPAASEGAPIARTYFYCSEDYLRALPGKCASSLSFSRQ